MVMDLPEIVPEVTSLVEGGEEAAGAGSGVEKDFNDAPVGKTLGSRLGSAVKNDLAFHGAESMLGLGHGGGGGGQSEAGPPTGGVDIGPMGNVG